MQKLLEFIEEIQSDERYSTFDEAATRQGIVLKILSLLEWDPFNIDEIHPEYAVGNGKVDFSLRHKNADKAFILVRKGGKGIQKHQEELIDLAAQKSVKIGALTDGSIWWFLLPLLGETVEEKNFQTLDLTKNKTREIAQGLNDFLSKQSITSGRAIKAAEEIYLTKQREIMLKENLPKAWRKLVSEPEKWLVELVGEMTKKMCGYKPDREIVEKFIANEVDAKADISSMLKPRPAAPTSAPPPPASKESARPFDYTGKTITSFSLKGKAHEVKSWKAMLLKLCDIIFPKHKEDLDIVLTLSEGDREFFSKNPYEFLTGERIPGTDLYVDVNLKAMEVVDLSKKILALFGYGPSDLSIQIK
ncbi:MAG: restriction endonuclease subunit R [Deltaproteobacteria bacterium]|jgi:hypothetical protein